MITFRKTATAAPSPQSANTAIPPEDIGTIVTRSVCEAMAEIRAHGAAAYQQEGSPIIATFPSNSFM